MSKSIGVGEPRCSLLLNGNLANYGKADGILARALVGTRQCKFRFVESCEQSRNANRCKLMQIVGETDRPIKFFTVVADGTPIRAEPVGVHAPRVSSRACKRLLIKRYTVQYRYLLLLRAISRLARILARVITSVPAPPPPPRVCTGEGTSITRATFKKVPEYAMAHRT